MDPILGIDLGTTNSVVSIIQDGKPVPLRDARGQAILPSVVGLDSHGQLLVGQAARNQALVAPEADRAVDQTQDGPGRAVPHGRQGVLAAGNLGDDPADAGPTGRAGIWPPAQARR